jgi:hypothetical protein
MNAVIDALTGHPWRGVMLMLIGASLLTAPVSWLDDGLTPSLVVYPIVLLIGTWRLSRGGRSGTLYFGVAALVFFLVHVPFSWAALRGSGANPADPSGEYSPLLWTITLFAVPLLTAVSGLFAWREARTRTAMRGIPAADEPAAPDTAR